MRISISYNGTYILEPDQLIVDSRKDAGGYTFSCTLRGSPQSCHASVSFFGMPEFPA